MKYLQINHTTNTNNDTNTIHKINNPLAHFTHHLPSTMTSIPTKIPSTIPSTIPPNLSMMQRLTTNVKLMMLFLSRVLFYSSFLAMILLIIYYSLSLYKHGKEAHLIAWFSAGAFVIMGFPISMYGILGHLRNYESPGVQCYVVRILWMVPIYSIESWLCLRFHEYEVYIATLRDCYESYVIYCFFSFLIAVLGGEDKLTMMLKDKSPTRGFHLTPVNCCVKPWIMGQPVENLGGRVKWKSPFFIKCKVRSIRRGTTYPLPHQHA